MAIPVLRPNAAALAKAARALRRGELVAFPTETVYGLGADATSDRAVAGIYAAKRRPRFNPIIVHVPNRKAAEALVVFDSRALALARRFWPGPLTLVLKRRADCPVSLLTGAGLDSLGVRVPDHPVALALLRATGRPLAAPSANPAGRLSPTSAASVATGLGKRVGIVLDGGPCAVGVESTVVDLTTKRAVLLRPGGVPREAIAAVVGPVADAGTHDSAPCSPGRLASHYAPRRPLRLKARRALPGEALLAFGQPPAGVHPDLNLSPGGDVIEAAANLFAMLRALDQPKYRGIAVMPIPKHGLGEAINDRLRRAAQR